MNDAARSLLAIQIRNKQRRHIIYPSSIASFCAAVLKSFDQESSALSIAFVSPREMRLINRNYHGHDYATDVLSFCYEGEEVDAIPFLGEIVIAPEVAFTQAVRRQTSLDQELRRLLVHGVLHLLGYDHEVDRGRMNRIQAKLVRRRFFKDTPPIEVSKNNP